MGSVVYIYICIYTFVKLACDDPGCCASGFSSDCQHALFWKFVKYDF